MLHASPVHFVSKVGVAPSTTTMMIPAARASRGRYRVPYSTVEDLRASNGLGVVNESDAWLTGRPYGLPGTASVKFVNGPNGVASMMVGGGFGHAPAQHSQPYIVGGGAFGDATGTASEIALQQIATAQQQQQDSMSRMAFWASIAGATAVAASVTTILVAIITGASERR